MLFIQNLWTMTIDGEGDYYLVSNNRANNSQKIFANSLMSKLNGELGLYKFYVFSFDTVGRYVFITKLNINFTSFVGNPGKRDTAYLVNGALYDLKEREFVKFERTKPNNIGDCYFYEFYIYDTGVPHIVYDRSINRYEILFLMGRRRFDIADEIVATVTTITSNGTKRAVFYRNQEMFYKVKKDDDAASQVTKELMLLDDGVSYFASDMYISFKDCIFDKDKYSLPGFNPDFCATKETKDAINIVPANSYITYDYACVIAETPKGELGNFVTIVLGESILFNYFYSCFKYKVVKAKNRKDLANHLILKCEWILNDFENGISYLDVSTQKIYEKKDFEEQ